MTKSVEYGNWAFAVWVSPRCWALGIGLIVNGNTSLIEFTIGLPCCHLYVDYRLKEES